MPWSEVELDAITLSHGTGVPGDADADGDVDLADFLYCPDCMNGPVTSAVGTECNVFDFDLDGVVDLRDFAYFNVVFSATTQEAAMQRDE